MSKMNDFLMDAAREFQKYHPVYTIDECMEIITNSNHDIGYWMNYKDTMKLRMRRETICIHIEVGSFGDILNFSDHFRKSLKDDQVLKYNFDESNIFIFDGDAEEAPTKEITIHIVPRLCTISLKIPISLTREERS